MWFLDFMIAVDVDAVVIYVLPLWRTRARGHLAGESDARGIE